MALAHKIGLTGLSPINRMPAYSRVAALDGMQVEELAEKPSVYSGGANFYYEDLLDSNGQAWTGRQIGHTSRTPERRINRGLIFGTTQSFTDAFSLANSSIFSGANSMIGGTPTAPMGKGISTYENVSRIIYNENSPRGESLNFNT